MRDLIENAPKITNLVVAPQNSCRKSLATHSQVTPAQAGGPTVQPHPTKGPSVRPWNCLKTVERRKH